MEKEPPSRYPGTATTQTGRRSLPNTWACSPPTNPRVLGADASYLLPRTCHPLRFPHHLVQNSGSRAGITRS